MITTKLIRVLCFEHKGERIKKMRLAITFCAERYFPNPKLSDEENIDLWGDELVREFKKQVVSQMLDNEKDQVETEFKL